MNSVMLVFPEKLERICTDASMPTSQITLELTESNIINNIRSSLDVLYGLN